MFLRQRWTTAAVSWAAVAALANADQEDPLIDSTAEIRVSP